MVRKVSTLHANQATRNNTQNGANGNLCIYWHLGNADEIDLPQQINEFDAVVLQFCLRSFKADISDLTRIEVAKLDGISSGVHRNRQLATRSILRRTLAEAVGRSIDGLEFQVGRYGKPYHPSLGLQFNISHCEDTLLLAISRKYAVGVDIELLRPTPEWPDIAQNWPPIDVDTIINSDTPNTTFLSHWVQREAILKAHGYGLKHSSQLDKISIASPDDAIVSPWGSVRLDSYCNDMMVCAIATTDISG